jgi:hypothetical protein
VWHGAADAIDDVHPVVERVLRIEGEEFVFNGNSRTAGGGDRLKQLECAAEFIVKDGSGHVVASLGTAA